MTWVGEREADVSIKECPGVGNGVGEGDEGTSRLWAGFASCQAAWTGGSIL